MTTTLRALRIPAAVAVTALALFTAACEPDGAAGTAVTTAAAASPSSVVVSPSASPSAAPTSASPSAVPSPSPSSVPPSTAPVPSPPPTTRKALAPTQAPVQAPTRTSENPAPAPTHEPTRQGPAGSCAHHTVGSCGWDAGLTPVGADEMAQCKDGTPSYSASFSGTCSHHGGVLYWFK